MDALQACAAALGLFYSRREISDPAYVREAVVRLLAKVPTMVHVHSAYTKNWPRNSGHHGAAPDRSHGA